ncbi:TIGR02530 family flagellar biosynthesis protein [Paenibacillus hunanensis]|uniref:Flagellar operon protein n=1 Tax=Paenibacillus hunanensis TaxID=539262 RepID=A0ABU1IZM8_9BACL|nr:TIGR02530 family flagellar biosynthesis protein [Paenibacillus hunanensis]MCL9660189.1 flagellar biosynthesis protein [Paenibacillus hunanensis]MDR6244709.1 flagellar operon protein [Paenibacillus hunanensis]WPP39835.1 TIGR02530 family flagellar biosynthesis protein [Paenibacillus hunanensis]GGJ22233.1 flagellar protein [Paenibacillus hunanensis]
MNGPIQVGQLYPSKLNSSLLGRPNNQATAGQGNEFKAILDQNLLKFSNHASKRLEQRGIQFSTEQMTSLNQAIDKAAAKGSKDSLILMQNNVALIVNVPNRTVVTAMDGNSMKDNVFTQIDSAVIL